MVGDEVVDVVRAFPPAQRETAAEIGHPHANQRVDDKVARDGAVAGVVGREHELVPEETQETGRRHVPVVVEGRHGQREEERVARRLLGVLGVVAGVEALVVDALGEDAVLLGNVLLDDGVDGGELEADEVGVALLGPGRVGGGIALEDLGRDGGVLGAAPEHFVAGGDLGGGLDAAVDGRERCGHAAGREVAGAVAEARRVLVVDVDVLDHDEGRGRGRGGDVVELAEDAASDWRGVVLPEAGRLAANPEGLHGLEVLWLVVPAWMCQQAAKEGRRLWRALERRRSAQHNKNGVFFCDATTTVPALPWCRARGGNIYAFISAVASRPTMCWMARPPPG